MMDIEKPLREQDLDHLDWRALARQRLREAWEGEDHARGHVVVVNFSCKAGQHSVESGRFCAGPDCT